MTRGKEEQTEEKFDVEELTDEETEGVAGGNCGGGCNVQECSGGGPANQV